MTTSTQAQVAAGRGHAAFHRLRVAAVERLTADAVAVTFDVPPHLAAAYAFSPGQHLTLRTRLDGQEVRRSYSICAPPPGPLRIAVKRLEGGLFSGHVTGSLRPGDEIDVLTPAGRFGVHVDPARARHYAAVVAGSGITPVLSILLAVLRDEPGSRFTLVDGNRDASSVMFAEEIADAKDRWPDRLQVLHVLSREQAGADLLTGRLDAAKVDLLLRGVLPPGAVDEWFLCGPFGMVEQVRTALVERGVPPTAIHLELFHVDGEAPRVARPAASPGEQAALVTVRLDGRSTSFPMPEEGSVLDAVLAVRPDAPYACRGGVCGTCRARLVEGTVTMARRYALEDDEVEAGFVLACQSVPTSPRLALDFDA